MIKLFPFYFIILWSSAFVTTKPIINFSEPFSALSLRFLLVTLGFFLFSFIRNYQILDKSKNILKSILSGILFHGFYLGGVFFSISNGLPTGIAALIVTLNPLLINVFAGPVLNEKISTKQWFGSILGFSGAAIVLGLDIGGKLPLEGVIAVFISLIAITIGTFIR